MKPALLILTPLVIVSGFVISHQMQEKATAPKPESTSTTSSNRPALSTRSKLAEIDWAAIAKDLTPSSRSQDILRKLSVDELRVALRQTNPGSLDPSSLEILRRQLLTLLIESDPGSLLTGSDSSELTKNIRYNWKSHALAEWTRQAPLEATSWLDSLSDRSFPEDQLITLKRHHFSSLIIADFESAKVRLQETPPKQRYKMIENYDGFGTHWKEDDFKNHNITGKFAELVRTFSTAGSNRFITFILNVRGAQDRPMGIGLIQRNLKDWKKGYRTWVPANTLADFFDKISATPEEQKLCLDEIVQQFSYFSPTADASAFRQAYLEKVTNARTDSN